MVKPNLIVARSLLGGIPLAKLPSLPNNATTTNAIDGINVLAAAGSGVCDIGEVACGDGCMPIGGVCCSGYVILTHLLSAISLFLPHPFPQSYCISTTSSGTFW